MMAKTGDYMFEFCYSVSTHNGCVRKKNEDNYYVDGFWREDVSICRQCLSGKSTGRLTAIVCDGMGGQDAGEIASQLVIKTANDMLQTTPKPLFSGRKVDFIKVANERICQYMEEHGLNMGSTLAALEFSDNVVTSVNIGDSRCYLIRNGELHQISVDHSVAHRMITTGDLTAAQAREHRGRHELTQYLGVRPSEMILEPAVRSNLTIRNEDRYLLCSDGLTEAVEDDSIRDILKRDGSCEEIAEQLLSAAINNHASDNVTVIVIQVLRVNQSFLRRIENAIRRWQ